MEGIFDKIKQSKSKTFLAFCFCFVFGVGVGSYFDLTKIFLFHSYILFFVIIFLIIIIWHKVNFRYILLFSLFFLIGIMRLMLYQPIIDKNHIAYYNNSELEFIGQITEEPDVRMGYINYIINVQYNKKENNYIHGQVQVKTKLYPRYSFGDYLQIKCKLKSPENFSDKFLYDKYLARFGIYSVCYYPQILAVNNVSFTSFKKGAVNDVLFLREGGEVSSVYRSLLERDSGGCCRSLAITLKAKILSFKFIIANQIDKLWPEPHSSFMAGLLYGSRSGLPNDLTDNFNRTGITHIIAISGYNISIVVIFVMTGLIYIGFYRQQAFWFTLLIIFLFVIFTGASASVVRAGIMGSIILLAQYLGRLSKVGNLLILTVVIMLIINPLILLYDVGFQLSFLATLGLVYLYPILSNKRTDIFFINNLKELTIATLSAIIATLPLILYQFGRLSVVALIVNVLILWIIPWLMLFGFLAVISSIIFLPLGQMIAYFTSLGLEYVIIVVNWFGRQSWSSIEINLPFWLMILIYIFMLFIFVYAKNKSNFTKFM